MAFCLVFDDSFKEFLKNNRLKVSNFCYDKLYKNCINKETDCLKFIKKINYRGTNEDISKYSIAITYGLLTGFRLKSINKADKSHIVEILDTKAKPMILKLIRNIKNLLIEKNV